MSRYSNSLDTSKTCQSWNLKQATLLSEGFPVFYCSGRSANEKKSFEKDRKNLVRDLTITDITISVFTSYSYCFGNFFSVFSDDNAHALFISLLTAI